MQGEVTPFVSAGMHGCRLGLYAALKTYGPCTAGELAEHLDLNERYCAEWLRQQASAKLVSTDEAAEEVGASGGLSCEDPPQRAVDDWPVKWCGCGCSGGLFVLAAQACGAHCTFQPTSLRSLCCCWLQFWLTRVQQDCLVHETGSEASPFFFGGKLQQARDGGRGRGRGIQG